MPSSSAVALAPQEVADLPTEDQAQKELLVVHEVDHLREQITNCLVDAGYCVYSTGLALHAVSRIKTQLPALIICHHSPLLDAYKVLDLVDTNVTPFVIILCDDDDREAWDQGVNFVFHDPLVLADLLTLVENLLDVFSEE